MRITWPDPDRYRPPETPWEEWLAKGLLLLADLDADRATIRNGVGFCRDDSDPGARWASVLRREGGLNEKGWMWARRAVPKYRRQIGEPPK